MRNEDELMIALDIIKTYSEAAKINGDQLNDAIRKIEGVRSDLVKAVKSQAQETVKNEISEPIKELKNSADQYWKESSYLVHKLKEQSEKNRWRNSFILGIGSSILLGFMVLGIFLWLPSLDEIKGRRTEYNVLKKYGLDISTCNGKTCVKVESNRCPYGENGNYCIAVIK